MYHKTSRSFRLWLLSIALILGLLLTPFAFTAPAHASGFVDEKLDSALVDELNAVPGGTLLEVVIVFNDTSVAPQIDAVADTFYQFQVLPMAGAILTADQIGDISNMPEIYSITLNQTLDTFLAESVPFVGADQVWNDYGEMGGNATVAVVDSGIDGTHGDLPFGDKVVQNVKMLPYGAGVEDVPLTDTSSGHGTHVASTIAGTGAQSGGYYKGMAPAAKLVGLGSGEAISILTAAESYDWILQNHDEYDIRVINNSWGSSGGDVNLRNPINVATLAAYKEGILSVFAAGNDGGYDIMNPYSIVPWVLGVAAGDKSGELADFSSRGKDGDYFKHPDLTAPGVDIYAARSSTIGITALDPDPNPVDPTWTVDYTKMSGTSMATPHVAGAAALLFSGNPDLSPDQVMDLLLDNVDPMPDTLLHEAGYGYMNVLAAYEDSLDETGNLDAFLNGEWQHSEEEVLGFDPNYAPVYDETLYTGFTPAGANGLPNAHEHPIEVTGDAQYVHVRLNWDPQAEDAYDMEVLDPDGNLVASSGNGANEGETALFVPSTTGTYTLRIVPFAAVASRYQALVKTAYGEANPPQDGEPAYDYYLSVTNVYKDAVAVGLAAEYFREGETGFVSFSVMDSDGTPAGGMSDPLQIVYTDAEGNTITVDDSPNDQGSGDYSSSFDFADPAWDGVHGLVNVHFAWDGDASLRAPMTHFYLNHLDVTFNTDATNYQPGDQINFDGTVTQINTIATNDFETAPAEGAVVTVKLVDADGQQLASTQALSDMNGEYSGALTAPSISRGPATLLVDAVYEEDSLVYGPTTWHGETEASIIFPGNIAPEASLSASAQSHNGKTFLHVEATASDADGAGDIHRATLVATDGNGRLMRVWRLPHFRQTDDTTLFLDKGVKAKQSSGPWTLSLTVTDSAGQSVVASTVVNP